MSEVGNPDVPKAASVRIVEKLQAVGDLPSAATRILDAAYRSGAVATEAAHAIDGDPSIASRLMKLVNASRNGSRPVITAAEAFDAQGLKVISGNVMAIVIHDMFPQEGMKSLDMGLFLRHSLAVAAAARVVAEKTGYRRDEDAWLTGLLHDIGRAALDATAPEESARALEALSAVHGIGVDIERDAIGIDHAAIGEFVLRRWGVPEAIAGAVGLHHSESLSGLKDRQIAALAAVVQAADFLAWANGFGGLAIAPKLAATPVVEKALLSLKPKEVSDAITASLRAMSAVFGDLVPKPSQLREALAAAATELALIQSREKELAARLERKIREVDAANILRMRVRQSFEKQEVKLALLAAVRQGLGFDRAVFLDAEESGALRRSAVDEAAPSRTGTLSVLLSAPEPGTPLAKLIETDKPAILAADELPAELAAATGAAEVVGAPVTAAKRLVGLVIADNAVSKRPLSEGDVSSVSVIAAEAGLAFENLMLYEHAQRMKTMAETDSLTGLHNRRYLIHLLQGELDRAKRYSLPLSLVLIDLEGFKPFNDKYGHQVGDTVLKSFGRLLRKSCRNIDIPGRLGGDEFLVILPGTNLDAAGVYVERLRKLLAELDQRLREKYEGCSLTMSVGVTSFNEASDNLDSFMHRADQAMYAAKQRGRNRVCAL